MRSEHGRTGHQRTGPCGDRRGWPTALVALVGAVLAVGTGLAGGAGLVEGADLRESTGPVEIVPPRERIRIDRWLLSGPVAPSTDTVAAATDTADVGAPTPDPAGGEAAPTAAALARGPLSEAEARSVLPERGRVAAGVRWELVRADSTVAFSLGSIGEELPDRPLAYAHAYIRAPADRTLQLGWGGSACAGVEARLNGARLEPEEAAAPPGGLVTGAKAQVRIGRGWNTLLLEVRGRECVPVFGAWLEGAAGALEGVRAQASRPPGDVRTGPAPWVLAGGPRIETLAWRGEELFAALLLPVTVWGTPPPDSVRLEWKPGGEARRGVIRTPAAARPVTFRASVPFRALRRAALREEGSELKLRWEDADREARVGLEPAAVLRAFHSRIALRGWTDAGGGAPVVSDDGVGAASGDLPGSGRALAGAWEVPRWLGGFALELRADGAPGEWTREGTRARREAGPADAGSVRAGRGDGGIAAGAESLVLCDPCEEGAEVRLRVRTTAAWSRWPGVRVRGPAPDPTADRSPPAGRWLEWLDGDGARRYREALAGSEVGSRRPK